MLSTEVKNTGISGTVGLILGALIEMARNLSAPNPCASAEQMVQILSVQLAESQNIIKSIAE